MPRPGNRLELWSHNVKKEQLNGSETKGMWRNKRESTIYANFMKT
jgi:hypothetical protein